MFSNLKTKEFALNTELARKKLLKVKKKL